MNLLIKIVLVLFITFIAMPTVIGIVDKDIDTAYFYNMEEEEENLSSFNEIKMVQNITYFFSHISDVKILKTSFIHSDENLDGSYSTNIFLPPPEII